MRNYFCLSEFSGVGGIWTEGGQEENRRFNSPALKTPSLAMAAGAEATEAGIGAAINDRLRRAAHR